jgi:small multidrug resistance pump
VFFEVVATVSLKASEEFTRFWPSATVVMCYGVAFYLLSLCLKTIPLGVMYAIWSGLGVVLTALFGWLVYKEHLDPPAFIGIAFILAGVAIIRLFSDASAA